MLIPKLIKVKCKIHRAYIASLPCMICDRHGTLQASQTIPHHLLRAEGGSMGGKACERYCFPMCMYHHGPNTNMQLRDYHAAELFDEPVHGKVGERDWFEVHGITYDTVIAYTRELCLISPSKKIQKMLKEEDNA